MPFYGARVALRPRRGLAVRPAIWGSPLLLPTAARSSGAKKRTGIGAHSAGGSGRIAPPGPTDSRSHDVRRLQQMRQSHNRWQMVSPSLLARIRRVSLPFPWFSTPEIPTEPWSGVVAEPQLLRSEVLANDHASCVRKARGVTPCVTVTWRAPPGASFQEFLSGYARCHGAEQPSGTQSEAC